MCIKAGDNELGAVKALMTMSLNAVFGEVFGLEPEQIEPALRLGEDLHMTAAQRKELTDLVAEYFDGLVLDLAPGTTLGDVFERVIESEFAAVAAAMH